MKNTLFKGLTAVAVVLFLGCTKPLDTVAQADLKSFTDSLSYSVGVQLSSKLGMDKSKVNTEFVLAGLRDALAEKAKLSTDQAQQLLTINLSKTGMDYLNENAKKEGVVTLPSGLQYKTIAEGTGAVPTATNVVTVHYTGKLIDGTVFDSSVQRGEPATFPLNGVIPGWTEGLQQMKEGGKIELYIPHQLAYGPRGAGNVIPPFSTLVFEVELIKIEQ